MEALAWIRQLKPCERALPEWEDISGSFACVFGRKWSFPGARCWWPLIEQRKKCHSSMSRETAACPCPHIPCPLPSSCRSCKLQGELQGMKEANRPASTVAAVMDRWEREFRFWEGCFPGNEGKFPLSSVISLFESSLIHLPTLTLPIMNFASFYAQ